MTRASLSSGAAPHWQRVALAATMALATLLYLPALRGAFLWDDDANVTENLPLRTAAGLLRIWTDLEATQQYYPLTHSSFWLQYQLFGANPLPYHVANLLLHFGSTLLLWHLLRKLAVPGALLAAIVFCIHPVHVESVAWITERKNVLSLPLVLAATLAYGTHRGWFDGTVKRRFSGYWWAGLALFCLALGAKTAVSVVPAVLSLIDWWRSRGSLRRAALDAAPLWLVGLGAGLLTAWLEVHHVQAQGSEFSLSFVERLFVAGRIFWFYPFVLLVPVDLLFIYPRFDTGPTLLNVIALLAVPASLTAAWSAVSRLGKGPLVALLAYGVLIFPALGFFNVFFMRYSFVQNHFCYAASVPLIALLAAGATRLVERLPSAKLGPLLAAAWCTTFALPLWAQANTFASNEALFSSTLVGNPKSWLANTHMGLIRENQGRLEEAVAYYRAAIEIYPGSSDAHSNLAVLLAHFGHPEEALVHLRAAVEFLPTNPEYLKNYALALTQASLWSEAAPAYQAALALSPNDLSLLSNYARLRATAPDSRVRDGLEAEKAARHACSIRRSVDCLALLADALAEAGKAEEAAHAALVAAGDAKKQGQMALAESLSAKAQRYYRGGKP